MARQLGLRNEPGACAGSGAQPIGLLVSGRRRTRPRSGRGRPSVVRRRAEHRRGAHPHRTLVPCAGADFRIASVASERAYLSSCLRGVGGSHPRALSRRALPSRNGLGVGLAGCTLADRGDHRARTHGQSNSTGGSIRNRGMPRSGVASQGRCVRGGGLQREKCRADLGRQRSVARSADLRSSIWGDGWVCRFAKTTSWNTRKTATAVIPISHG